MTGVAFDSLMVACVKIRVYICSPSLSQVALKSVVSRLALAVAVNVVETK